MFLKHPCASVVQVRERMQLEGGVPATAKELEAASNQVIKAAVSRPAALGPAAAKDHPAFLRR